MKTLYSTLNLLTVGVLTACSTPADELPVDLSKSPVATVTEAITANPESCRERVEGFEVCDLVEAGVRCVRKAHAEYCVGSFGEYDCELDADERKSCAFDLAAGVVCAENFEADSGYEGSCPWKSERATRARQSTLDHDDMEADGPIEPCTWDDDGESDCGAPEEVDGGCFEDEEGDVHCEHHDRYFECYEEYDEHGLYAFGCVRISDACGPYGDYEPGYPIEPDDGDADEDDDDGYEETYDEWLGGEEDAQDPDGDLECEAEGRSPEEGAWHDACEPEDIDEES